MTFAVYSDPDATALLALLDTLEEALPLLARNHTLVLPADWLPADPIEIDVDAVTLHVQTAGTVIRTGPAVSVLFLTGPAAAIVETGDSGAVVHGGDAGVTLRGGEGRDIVHGGAGDDILFGGDGRDVLFGGAGDDLIVSGGDYDQLHGGAGDDILIGGTGRNSFHGGEGADMMVVGSGAGGFNVMFDFDAAEGDRLVLASAEAPVNWAHLLATGTIQQGGAHTVIRFGSQTVQFLNTDISDIDESVVLFDTPPEALPRFDDAGAFLASGLDTILDQAFIGDTLYHLRDAEPLHADYKFQDAEGRWWSPDYVVVVAAGQSNMVGAGIGGDMTLDANVTAWDWVNGELILADYAAPPSGGEGVSTGTVLRNNLYFPFANEIAAETGRPVMVIAHPVSGSRIDSWLSELDGANWAALNTDIEQALAAIGQDKVDSFLWHQGESDFVLDPAVYGAKFLELVGQLRAADWGGAEMPLLVGELSRAGLNHIQNAALQAIEMGNSDPFLSFVSSTGLSTFDATQIHFSGAALIDFAQRYFDAFAQMTGLAPATGTAPNTAPIPVTSLLPEAITMAEGEVLSLDLSGWFADAEGDPLWVYGHLDDRSKWIVSSDGTTLTLRPDYDDAGSHVLRIFASDYLLDSAAIELTLTITDRDPALIAFANRDFDNELRGYQDVATALADLDANRGIDIMTEDAFDADGPTLITLDAITIRGAADLAATFQLDDGILRSYLAGAADFGVIGNALNNQITGNDGGNALSGGEGNDHLWGEAGDDLLIGGAGGDRLYGGAGNDRVDAGPGNDQAWGGDGADTFVFAGGDGMLQIRDFEAGTDRIEIADWAGAEDFAGLMDLAWVVQSGSRAMIDLAGDRLLIWDLNVTDLTADMFDFV